ncbi:MAG: hypothetical protein EHM50_06020 [Lysobacterales bacterium]|nr:MAG: hypothetical protein EHM50_06020 [Xanthomonadales bacterium]
MRDVAGRTWLIAFAISSCVIWQCARPPSEHPVAPVDASVSSDPTGEWRGYVEHMDFGDGSGTVALRFDAAASGSVVFGTGNGHIDDPGSDAGQREIGVVAGFAYTVHRVRADGERLRFLIEYGDAMESWCVAQRPRKRLDGTDHFGCPERGLRNGERCFFNSGGPSRKARPMPDSGIERELVRRETIPVDCELFEWCDKLQSRCHCTDTGCTPHPGSRVAFDLTIRGDVADGSIESPDGTRNVHLKRVRP